VSLTFEQAIENAVRAEWVARAARAGSVRQLEHDVTLEHEARLATAAAARAWELVRCSVPPVDQLARRRITFEAGQIRLWDGPVLCGTWCPGILRVDPDFTDDALRWLVGGDAKEEAGEDSAEGERS
jgi:hypothetical protein